jgi:hypothetical protein
MRLSLKILVVLVAGTMLGLLATWLAVFRFPPGAINDGPWKAIPEAATAQSDAYRRAIAAVHGLFAMNRARAIYYTATTDSEGHTLTGQCRYKVEGPAPDARWWSITAYGPDDYLIANPTGRYSVTKQQATPDARGNIAVLIGGTSGGGSLVPVGTGRFSLSLRLYNPGPEFIANPAAGALPALLRVACP